MFNLRSVDRRASVPRDQSENTGEHHVGILRLYHNGELKIYVYMYTYYIFSFNFLSDYIHTVRYHY